jgi:hypothetical protein
MRLTARRGLVIASVLVLAAAVAGAVRAVDFFTGWFYQLAWFPLLVACDSALSLRTGKSALLDRPAFAISLFLWSAPAWFLFEAANLRLANWYYVFVPVSRAARWGGTVVAFSTVLPALCLAYRWGSALGIASGFRGRGFSVRSVHLHLLRGFGAAFLILSLWRPETFFPLIWGSVTLLLEPLNYRRDPARSLFGDISRGQWMRLVRLMVGGAVVGLVWELLNSMAGARWIYTVPGLEHWKAFEMPLPGFLGFPVFALDAFVIYQSLVLAGVAAPGWHSDTRVATGPPRRHRAALAALLAAGFSIAVMAGIDHWTVDSVRPRLETLPGVDADLASRLESGRIHSVRSLAESDTRDLKDRTGLEPRATGDLIAAARMTLLRGLGSEHTAALWRAGIVSACDLAATDAGVIAEAVRRADPRPYVGKPARVRVWRRAALAECGEATEVTLLAGRAERILPASGSPCGAAPSSTSYLHER